jgi:hypothetical protein
MDNARRTASALKMEADIVNSSRFGSNGSARHPPDRIRGIERKLAAMRAIPHDARMGSGGT